MSRKDKLARLRAARAGQLVDDSDFDSENEIYDMVDENTYKEHKRDRVLNDNFIVDDNGEGYAETGADDWEQKQYYSDDAEHEEPRKEKKKVKMVAGPGIAGYFNRKDSNGVKTKDSKMQKKKIDKSELDDILNDFTKKAGAKRKNPFGEKNIHALTTSTPSINKVRKVDSPEKKSDDTLFYTAQNFDTPSSPTKATGIVGDILGDLDVSIPRKKDIEPIKIDDSIQESDVDDDDSDDDDVIIGRRGRKTVQVDRSVLMASSRGKTIDSSPLKNITRDIGSSPSRISNTSAVSNITFEKMDENDVVMKDDEGDDTVEMFWLDYCELDTSLLLFGKVKTKDGGLASGVVQIKGINRNLYVLPRDKKLNLSAEDDEEEDVNEENGYGKPCTPMDVYEELVPLLMDKYGLDSIKAKPEKMKYAFENPEVPQEADYLKVLMPYEVPQCQNEPVPDMEGESFSKIFGTNQSIFESFVLQRNVMGPCWLTLQHADFSTLKNASHCNVELCVDDPTDVTVDTFSKSLPPSLNVMSINVQPYLNAKTGKQEVGSVALALYKDLPQDQAIGSIDPTFEMVLTRPVAGSTILPQGLSQLAQQKNVSLRGLANEKILLNCLMGMIKKYDPDVFLGHRLENISLDILMHRMKDLNISQWSNMGRRVRRQFPDKFSKNSRFNLFVIRELCAGRLLCDISNEMGQSLTPKCQSWELPEMFEVVCKEKYSPIEVNLSNPALEDASKFLSTVNENLISVKIIAKTAWEMKILQLSKELTCLAGNAWSHTLGGTRAGRNEYILLHEFNKEGYIVPDKETRAQRQAANSSNEENIGEIGEENTNTTNNKKAKFQGGLVFEPEKGLHKNYILVMDFNSLYPSIIQEFNICFTTVARKDLKEDELPKVPPKTGDLGVLPRLLQQLVGRRRDVKQKMKRCKNSSEKDQLDIEQMALKVTANSMYGCLGYVNSRFYAKPLAMLVTTKGREILMDTRQLAESIGLTVVYGDTDSVMIDTGCDVYNEAIKIGNDFKAQVNQRYRLLEIDIDNIFKRLLLHSKKKYAALNATMTPEGEKCTLEVKGLDMKRREYCPLSKETSEFVLNNILLLSDPDEALNKIYLYLEEIAEQFESNSVPMVKLRINTKLSKDPSRYPGGKSMPAVQVALRMQQLGKIVKAGNVMTFVITDYKQADGASVAERARSLAEVLSTNKTAANSNTDSYKPDKLYYLEKQLMNPIVRLLERVPGFDIVQLAKALGLEAQRYESRARQHAQMNELQPLESTIPDSERFADARDFVVACPECGSDFNFGGIQTSDKYFIKFDGMHCSCGHLFHPIQLTIQLESFIRKTLDDYYQGLMICDSCNLETRQVAVYGKKCIGINGTASECNGIMHLKISDKDIYNQLMYLKSIFDVDKAKKGELKPISDSQMNKGEVDALAEQNRRLFNIWVGVINKYLDVNGRRFVDFGSIFGL
ncbi:DNA-directed DNA polymerase alpha catalytic subunit [Martiniozyma asiatica (nom. inval.)]|nr:DNA-directed DNA polymerase alpha catalytic subunit [Martiniozyma asiatica]